MKNKKLSDTELLKNTVTWIMYNVDEFDRAVKILDNLGFTEEQIACELYEIMECNGEEDITETIYDVMHEVLGTEKDEVSKYLLAK